MTILFKFKYCQYFKIFSFINSILRKKFLDRRIIKLTELENYYLLKVRSFIYTFIYTYIFSYNSN